MLLKTYPTVCKHGSVSIRKLLTLLIVVYALYAVTLLQHVAHDPCLHRAHPRLANVCVARGQARYSLCQPTEIFEDWVQRTFHLL